MSPPISREEEIELFAKYRAGDQQAGNKLAISMKKLVTFIANSHVRNPMLRERVIGSAWYGVARAIKNFDTTRGFRLMTYARQWVFAMIQDAHSKERRWCGFASSLDRPIGHEEDGDELTLWDRLCSQETHQISEWMGRASVREMWERVRGGLKHQEQVVIELRFLAETPLSFSEIAKRHNLSRQRIQQIEKKALHKLRLILSRDEGGE